MVDWAGLALFIYISARVSGFVLFNPLLSRNNFPAIYRTGVILVLTVSILFTTGQTVAVPSAFLVFAIRIMLELALGAVLGFVVNFFFYVPQLAGEVIGTQMGMTMSQTYDPGSQANMSVIGTFLNILMTMLFFAANGHHTLMRILHTSGDIIPYGNAALTTQAAEAALKLFVNCTLFAVKLSMPVLAAELLGQMGMGLLMKVIPQINVFAINIDLKVIIGLLMVLLLIAPISEYLLEIEMNMLNSLEALLELSG